MRHRLLVTRKTLAMGLGLLASAATARGEITLVETVDVVPTSVVALPRSVYVPSSYVATSSVFPTSYASVYDLSPTSYYVPTSYAVPTRYYVPARAYATSYYAPTSYYETTTYRRRPFGRRYYETSYLYSPTVSLTPTYYAPTTYVASSAVVASSACCETASAPVAPARNARPSAEPMPERQAGGTIESSVGGEPEERIEPIVPPANPIRQRPTGTSGNVGAPSPGPVAPAATSPTIPSPAVRDTRPAPTGSGTAGGLAPATGGTVPVPKPADGPSPPLRTEPEPPPVPAPGPAPGNPLDFPSTDDATRRSSYKPVVPSIGTRLAQNVLRGRVVSADSRMPESGVEVILVDRRDRFEDRTTRTDSSGRFALVVPEGDWTILLTMPSGRALPVDQGLVTASAGKVSDRWGRELTNLVLSR